VLARAVPLVLLVAAAVYLILALQLPFGMAARPGAGFYPVIVAVFAVVVALAATASAFRGVQEATAIGLEAAPRRRVVMSVVSLVVFCLVLPWVGYPVAAFAFVTVVLRYLGGRWTSALLTGALASAGSYGLFAVLLNVPLPRGLW
jgi:putative tricarboxylic transport membrane protein